MTPTDFKSWRLGLGYSQARAAQVLHKTVRTISRWETGQADIPYTVELSCWLLACRKHGRYIHTALWRAILKHPNKDLAELIQNSLDKRS